MILLAKKLLSKFQKSQKLNYKIVQKIVKNKHDKKYPKKDISPDERQKSVKINIIAR